MMKFSCPLLIVLCLLAGCKNRVVSLSGDEKLSAEEFIDFFPDLQPPVKVSDTSLRKPVSDSMRISWKNFTAFIPDSVVEKDFGKKNRPRLFAMGKCREKESDYYLFIKAESGSRKLAYLVCFDKKRQYAGAMAVVKPLREDAYCTATLDDKFQLSIYHQKKPGMPGSSYRQEVYIHNTAAADFTLILTEPNEEIISNVINPIDSLPRKGKYAGDYVRDKKNFLSVRDAGRPSEIEFFVHVEKENGQCVGELKGKARMIKSNVALYQEPGNPCALQMSFTSSSVKLDEKGGCGSYRGITCYFDDRFPKKKVPKPKAKKKK